MPERRSGPRRPAGRVTRGTTAPNRLRRFDRWYAGRHGARCSRQAPDPLVVDLGYGRAPVTVLELAARLRAVRPDVDVLGVEIDPERVEAARPLAGPGVPFAHGGFELAPLQRRAPVLVRAFNVLRQYDEAEVARGLGRPARAARPGRPARRRHVRRAGAAGLVGGPGAGTARARSCWRWRLAGLERPSQVAARLPKALIHRNVEGEGVHALLRALDAAWDVAAPLQPLGARQRLVAACTALVEQGWALRRDERQWRRGVLELPWSLVAPRPALPAHRDHELVERLVAHPDPDAGDPAVLRGQRRPARERRRRPRRG